jgi:tetratricopeptide (TPR) repeat protein
MYVCHDCSHPLEADDLFCSHCGSSVAATDRAVAVADPLPSASERAGSALGSLEVELQKDTTDAGRLVLAAFDRLCAGEIEDALLASESAVTMNPRLWTAHLIAGVTRNQRGETEQAEAHLHDALTMEPNAVHYKASLERLVAQAAPKRRMSVEAGWLQTMPPAAWAGLIGIPTLLIGLMVVSNSAFQRNEFRHGRPQYGSARQAPSNYLPIQPQSQPYPTPTTPAYRPPAPAYIPPSPYVPPLSGSRQSAPPPITYDDNRPAVSSSNSERPGSLPRAGDSGPIFPLPPAKPDVSGAPDLQARRSNGSATAAPQDPTPWTRPNPADQNRGKTGFTVSESGVGQARVGNDPAANARPNLPAPSDAVTSSSRVRPAPAVPKMIAAAPKADVAPDRPSGRTLQSEARRLQNQGQLDDAAQKYRDSISAYQDEMANGRNPRAAEYGIAASKAALDLIESGR